MPATLCYGSEDENGQPTCEGADVREVKFTEDGANGHAFTTHWCAECRAIAPTIGCILLTIDGQPVAER